MTSFDFLFECKKRLLDLQEQRVELDRKIKSCERFYLGFFAGEPPRADFGGHNLAQFMREVLSIAAKDGMTPRELRSLCERNTGRRPHKSFPYTQFYYMKKAGQVRTENGKYYQVQSHPQGPPVILAAELDT